MSVLRDVIHALSPDLDFYERTILILDCYMQGFITIRLRIGEPVSQSVRVGFILFSHIRIDLPAKVHLILMICITIDYESYGEHVIHTLERNFLLLHLLIYRVCSLGPDLEFVFDACVRKFSGKRTDKLFRQHLPILLCRFQLIGNQSIFHRISKPEINILQFTLHVIQSQLMSQRDI